MTPSFKSWLPTLSLVLAASLTACGDDDGAGNGNGNGNENQNNDNENQNNNSAPAHDRLMVATAAYGSGGGLTAVDLDTLESTVNVALAEDDNTLRWRSGEIWVLNRFGYDNVMILRDDDYQLVKQFSLKRHAGDGCNPQDVAFMAPDKVYVSCLQHADLLIVDPTADGSEVVGGIDLSSLADVDGWPEATRMVRHGDHVLVAIGRIDQAGSYAAVPPSRVARIDPATDALVDAIDLASLNPTSALVPIPGSSDVLLATSGDYSGASAGLERLDPTAGTSTLVLDATDLGGIVAAFVVDETECGFAVTMNPGTFANGLVRFCLDGSPVTPCIPMGTFGITDVVQIDDGRLLVTDTTATAPGVRAFDPDTCEELTPAVIPTGFAPSFTSPMVVIPAAE
jgi:hypothetical protein